MVVGIFSQCSKDQSFLDRQIEELSRMQLQPASHVPSNHYSSACLYLHHLSCLMELICWDLNQLLQLAVPLIPAACPD